MSQENNENRPRIVVFDLGGVLIRICRSWGEACAAAGLPVRGDTASLGTSGTRQALAEKHGTGEIPSEQFFELVATAMRGLYSADEVRRVHDAWLLGEYPGATALIGDLRRAGVPTGILSNTNHAHWVRQLARERGGTGEFLGAAQVDHPHASHLMKLLKPEEAMYREFERLTGFAGDEVLFFDDLEENIAGALACGWRAQVIDHTGDTAAQMRGYLRDLGVLV